MPAACPLHRLCADCALTMTTLNKLAKSDTPLCETCGVIEDVFHMLRSCPLYATYGDELESSIHSAPRPFLSSYHFFFPPWPPGSVEHVFRALLLLLEKPGLAIRL